MRFWWNAGPKKWWGGDAALDEEIREKFGDAHKAAATGALDDWGDEPAAALALIILLDQFSRNIHRGGPDAYAQDPKARDIAAKAIDKHFDDAFPAPAKQFFYLPFMHSEDMADQERAIDLYHAAGDEDGKHFALLHMDVIRRFGRFPGRNAALGRKTTDAEAAYMASGRGRF
ncbi:MAG: DUF924 family protein [Parvularculaceae bacterium]